MDVREGQRHYRHERRGCKRATRGDAGCGHSMDQYWGSHRWLELKHETLRWKNRKARSRVSVDAKGSIIHVEVKFLNGYL